MHSRILIKNTLLSIADQISVLKSGSTVKFLNELSFSETHTTNEDWRGSRKKALLRSMSSDSPQVHYIIISYKYPVDNQHSSPSYIQSRSASIHKTALSPTLIGRECTAISRSRARPSDLMRKVSNLLVQSN